ncbi:MAG TPA: hypothetical protein VKD72_05730 [Gemmataceae bacterium]|nr:hypothetical protein [Gemmataceae bacterium]
MSRRARTVSVRCITLREVLLAVVAVLAFGSGAGAEVLYVDLATGFEHSCAVKADRSVACWGNNIAGQTNPPTGRFTAVGAGALHTCGLRPDGTVACWGDNTRNQSTPPAGSFAAIRAGGWVSCSLTADGTPACWGDNSKGQLSVPHGQYRDIGVSQDGTSVCGVLQDRSGICWGQAYSNGPPAGASFLAISAGAGHACGLLIDGTVTCWGANTGGKATAPGGVFTAISAGGDNTCGVALDRSVFCWGSNIDNQSTPPPVAFARIGVGVDHGCGIQTDGRLACWGLNDFGMSTPPVDPPPLVNVSMRGCSPCRAGDVARIVLDFSNPGSRRTFEVAAVSHFPDGATVARLVPDDHEVTLEPGESTLEIPITVPAGLALGFYFLEAAVLDNFSGVTISRDSVSVRLDP